MASRALWMGELMLCIPPSADGVIPHQAWSDAQAPPLAKKVLTMCGCRLGEERGREALRAVQACVASLGFPVKFQLNFSHLQIQEEQSSLPSRCQGELLSSAGCNAGLVVLSYFAAFTRPAPTGWHAVPRLPARHLKRAPFL